METWTLLRKQHYEIFRKIQLLEEASIDLLKKEAVKEKLAKDFLEFFKVGIIQHFKIETQALFPILKNASESSGQLILELLQEHNAIMQRYSRLQKPRNPTKGQTKKIQDFLTNLSEHAKKEEEKLPPLIKMLTEKQLRMIDEKATSLDYPMLTA